MTKSLEELEEIEQDLLMQEGLDRNDGYYGRLINVYKDMYKLISSRARKTRDEYDNLNVNIVKIKLIDTLILYGTFMKMEHTKSDGEARSSLKEVLKYEPYNSIANYRLGFLAYKDKKYNESICYFQKAIDYQNSKQNQKWGLNEQQLYRAHLYLVNSSLFVANETNEKMKNFALDKQPLANYTLSPLFDIINDNEKYIRSRAFIKYTNNDSAYCSKEECDDIYEIGKYDNCIILYFSDREYGLSYNGERHPINASNAYLLKDFLLNSSTKQSLKLQDLEDHFQNTFIQKNTFIQRIQRLRNKLREFKIPEIIINDQTRGETAYYFNGTVPFIVMERVEESTD